MSGSRATTGPQPYSAFTEALKQRNVGAAPANSPNMSNPPNKSFGSPFTHSTPFPSQLFGTAPDSDAAKSQPTASTIFPTPLPTLRPLLPSSALHGPTFGQVSRSASPLGGGGGQPTKDAMTLAQSKALLFSRATSVLDSVPPSAGSHIAFGSAVPSTALPSSVSHEISRSSAGVTQSVIPRNESTAVNVASMDLLRGGTTVQIVVGTQAGEVSPNCSREVWDIEPALISQYSEMLRNACNRKQHSSERISITLPENDPYIFELFYIWMLDGTTTRRTTSLLVRNEAVNIDVQAWVLGDQLRSIGFKNYAMNRIYYQHATNFSPKAITPADVAYAFKHTFANSKLRQIYLDLFPKQWKNMPCVSNNVEEWDEIVHEHKDFRMRFYDAMRPDQYGKNAALINQTYMEVENASSASKSVVANVDKVTPAKRKAEDVLVKDEATDK